MGVKMTCLLVILSGFTSMVKAQIQLGLESGLTENFVATNYSSSAKNYVSGTGYYEALVIAMPLKKDFGIVLLPGIMQKNYVVNGLGGLSAITTRFQNLYL